MTVLQSQNISKSYGHKVILEKASIQINEGQRVGLVGPNGSGKSTLLKILAGALKHDAGQISMAKNARIEYLAQDGGLESTNSIWEEALTVFSGLMEMEKKLRQLELAIEQDAGKSSAIDNEKLLEEYADLSGEFSHKGGYTYQASARSVLFGLKFNQVGLDFPVSNLSGGQKTRLALAKILLAGPDMMMLDEPTNYLDIETLSWLAQHLQTYPGAILVVSHDRQFLDELVNVIYEIQQGSTSRYVGNYTKFIEQKKAKTLQLEKEFEKQQEEIARTQEFINKNLVRASTTGRAQSRRRTLEKMTLLEKPVHLREAKFSFNIERPSGREVLAARDLIIGYPGKTLSKKITFQLERGERVALVGPNGVGKSTLLKTIYGLLRPLKGYCSIGTHVSMGYYRQEQAVPDSHRQVLDDLWDRYKAMDEKDIRTVLGNFLFSGDDVYKSTGDLSGGERARLSLAKLMLKKANFLLLDEPTNHLDIYSKEVLEDALGDFPGTLLFVSHDRYFINKLATSVLELSPGGITIFQGNYDEYVNRKKMAQTPETGNLATVEPRKAEAKNNYMQEKELKRQEEKKLKTIADLEADIEKAEQNISSLQKEIFSPEICDNYNLLMEKNNRIEDLKSKLMEYYTQWEELSK